MVKTINFLCGDIKCEAIVTRNIIDGAILYYVEYKDDYSKNLIGDVTKFTEDKNFCDTGKTGLHGTSWEAVACSDLIIEILKEFEIS